MLIEPSCLLVKLRCDERFTHAFTAYGCVFKEITLVGSNQGNYFENATACSKRMRKTTVATQLQCCAVTDYKNISDLFPRFNTKERKNIEKGSASFSK